MVRRADHETRRGLILHGPQTSKHLVGVALGMTKS